MNSSFVCTRAEHYCDTATLVLRQLCIERDQAGCAFCRQTVSADFVCEHPCNCVNRLLIVVVSPLPVTNDLGQ